MYELKKKMERYLRVNILGPGPRLMKKNLPGRGPTKFKRHWSIQCTGIWHLTRAWHIDLSAVSYWARIFLTEGPRVTVVTKFYTVVPNILGPSVWGLLHVTLLAPGIFRWRLIVFSKLVQTPPPPSRFTILWKWPTFSQILHGINSFLRN